MDKKLNGTCLILIILILLTPNSVFATTQKQTNINSITSITIITPEEGKLYVWSRPIASLSINITILIGPIVIEAGVTGINGFEVDFFIDGELRFHDDELPFEYSWINPVFGTYLITAELTGYELRDNIKVIKIL